LSRRRGHSVHGADLEGLAGQLLEVSGPLIAFVTRLGDEYEEHLGLNGLGGLLVGPEGLLDDGDYVELAPVGHGAEGVDAGQGYDGCEHLFGFGDDGVDERAEDVAALVVVVGLGADFFEEDENVFEEEGGEFDVVHVGDLPF